jgi:hypothetical protein
LENKVRRGAFFLLYRKQGDEGLAIKSDVPLLIVLHEQFQVRLFLYAEDLVVKINVVKLAATGRSEADLLEEASQLLAMKVLRHSNGGMDQLARE